MLFDTFLDRFELRTGCYVMAILYMAFIIVSMHMPLQIDYQTSYILTVTVVLEKIVEMASTLMLLYATFKCSRKLLLVWQLLVPPIFIFNIIYCIYQGYSLNNLVFLSLLVVSMYLITYSLMLVNSFYDELGYIQDYLRDMSYIRSQNIRAQENRANRAEDSARNVDIDEGRDRDDDSSGSRDRERVRHKET